jgi:hypothetical protein
MEAEATAAGSSANGGRTVGNGGGWTVWITVDRRIGSFAMAMRRTVGSWGMLVLTVIVA